MPQHETYTGPWDLFVGITSEDKYYEFIGKNGNEYLYTDEPAVRKGKFKPLTPVHQNQGYDLLDHPDYSRKANSKQRTNQRKANRKTKQSYKETQDV